MSSSSGLLVSRERQMAESLGLEETEYAPQEDDEIDSDDDRVRSPPTRNILSPPGSASAARAMTANNFRSMAPASAVSLGRGGSTGFGHGKGEAGSGGVSGGENDVATRGGSANSAAAVQTLSATVTRLEGELAAAVARVDGATSSAKSQLAVFKRGLVIALRTKDRSLDEALGAARPEEAENLRAIIKKAHSTTDALERSSAGATVSAADDRIGEASVETLREDIIRMRLEISARTAAEQVVRAKGRAARALVIEFESALTLAGSGAGVGTLEVSLRDALERHAAVAARSALGDDSDYDPNAVMKPSVQPASVAATAFSLPGNDGGSAAAAVAALAAEREVVTSLSAQLAKAKGDVARAKDEAAAFRDKCTVLQKASSAGAEAARAQADATSRLQSAMSEKEVVEKDCARLSGELDAARTALDAARLSGGAGGTAGDELRRERDAARAEADSAREAAAHATAAAADAEARAAAALADAKSATEEAERAKVIEAAVEARAAASMASGDQAAAAQVAALEQALVDLKVKSKAEKEKLKAAAMRQFDDLKNKALDEINREKERGIEEAVSLRAELVEARSGASEAVAAKNTKLAAVNAAAGTLRAAHVSLAATLRKEFSLVASQMAVTRTEVGKVIKRIAESGSGLMEKYKKECAERRRLFNMVQELKGNVRVYARVRPPVAKELEDGNSVAVSFPAEGELCMINNKKQIKTWEFDQIFQPGVSNPAVFEEVEGLIGSTMDGFNVCIFAYGQTGSGKTFTMEGDAASRGINYRSIDTLFNIGEERKVDGWKFDITVAMLEIYNEDIRDMLAERGPDGLPISQGKLTIREGPQGLFVPGLTIESVKTRDEVLEIMTRGYKSRTTFSTNMNEHSSRSHAMLTIYVKGHNTVTGMNSSSKLHLVDLAGSERLSRTNAAGDRLKEAMAINKSLSALGDVIQARMEKAKHVPFRNSTLTFLLSDSLSNDSKTLMFVNLSPVLINADESICSLNFASRVRNVELGKAKSSMRKTVETDAAAGGGP